MSGWDWREDEVKEARPKKKDRAPKKTKRQDWREGVETREKKRERRPQRRDGWTG